MSWYTRAVPLRGTDGLTLVELVVVLAVLAVVAAITAPTMGAGRERLAVDQGARRLAVLLRQAQAGAQASDTAWRVVVSGRALTVQRQQGDDWAVETHGALGPCVCSTNYPQDTVAFDGRGLPLNVGTWVPRAGTLTVACGGSTAAVVVQLTGRVRIQ